MMGRRGIALVPMIAMAITLGLATDKAKADDPDPSKRERCATRLSIALLGESPAATLSSSSDPQADVPKLLKSPAFREHFSRFVNAAYNRDPGNKAAEDAPYWLSLTVLSRGRPWKDMFVGAYGMTETDDENVTITDDPEGLGYFRFNTWQRRYAGNELEGLKIATAYRIAQNILGLKLVAVTNDENTDVSADGRAKQPCAQCHQENWYALDKLATVLTRRNGSGDEMSFDPPQGGAQSVLGGVSVSSDKELVSAMVDSEMYRFRQCRLAFQFLYGRDENLCEGPVFDKCVTAFAGDGLMETAIGTVASHPTFCE